MLKLYILERFRLCSGACFQDLAGELCRYLNQAQYSIQAAVCWFSHREIFEVLLKRLRNGVHIELILEYDTQNIRPEGLDFQMFIEKGGQLYAFQEAALMHHKFAVVDNRVLLTGSFNWTYNANEENLLILDDTALVYDFQETFIRLKDKARRVFRVSRADAKVFAPFPLFENTQFPLAGLRKKVSIGTGVWTVRISIPEMDCMHSGGVTSSHPATKTGAPERFFKQSLLPFDAHGLLKPYWTAYRIWDDALFDEFFECWKNENVSSRGLRDLWCWTRRMKAGDLVFLIEKQAGRLLAVGVAQSDPQRYEGAGFSSYRAVQWLKIIPNGAYQLPEKVSGQMVARYRGSALRVLQDLAESRFDNF